MTQLACGYTPPHTDRPHTDRPHRDRPHTDSKNPEVDEQAADGSAPETPPGPAATPLAGHPAPPDSWIEAPGQYPGR
jgi:hypothetical protein